MIGFYNYTVWLTYLSLLSAMMGIIVALNGTGHPFLGMFFLLVSGLCDTFDGTVARTKQNRTDAEKSYGIQIDSLSDLIAFGALPACIGVAMLRVSPRLPEIPNIRAENRFEGPFSILIYAILLFYVLAALIRLAYFNVAEEERQKNEGGARTYYEGLPVTSAALIFPTILLIQQLTPFDITPVYFGAMFLTAIAFIVRFRVKKPKFKEILLMVLIGAVEFAILLFFWFFLSGRR